MGSVELDLILRPEADGIVADLLLRSPGEHVAAELIRAVPVKLDVTMLLEHNLDAETYGHILTEGLFAAPKLREAWARAGGYTQGVGTTLSVRLCLDPQTEHLHELHWETLCDPVTKIPLARAERTLFLRYLPTPDLGRVKTPLLNDVRVLVAIASPSDQERYGLAPIDVSSEYDRISVALGDVKHTTLATRPHGAGVTLNGLFDTLRGGYHVLYLVCHGTVAERALYLWLERDDGGSEHVPIDVFVERFASLPDDRRPLLVILASCQSSGGHVPVLSTLGPRLIQAGAGTVLGMQGDIPVALVRQMMPRFFRLLWENGEIERAATLARAELPVDLPWWAPVLYTRLSGARLWMAEPLEPGKTLPRVTRGIEALRELLQDPLTHDLVAGFERFIAAARAQVRDVIALKELHDALHLLQFKCYGPLVRELSRFPADEVAVESVADYQLTLSEGIARVHQVLDRSGEGLGDQAWVSDLENANTSLQCALETLIAHDLRRAIGQLNRILARQPSIIDATLVTRVGAMPLSHLLAAMEELHKCFIGLPLDTRQLQSFELGVTALTQLCHNLSAQVLAHHTWQAIDLDTRHVEEMLRRDTSELELSWPDIQAKLLAVAAGPEPWEVAIRTRVAQVDAALGEQNVAQAARDYRLLRRIVGEHFFQVDVNLLQRCSALGELRDPLDELLRELP